MLKNIGVMSCQVKQTFFEGSQSTNLKIVNFYCFGKIGCLARTT